MMRDKRKRDEKRMKEEQYRVPVFPMDLPPPIPDLSAGKEGGYEVDGILGLGMDDDHELDSINDNDEFGKTKTRGEDHYYNYYSDLLLKTETMSTSIYKYGDDEEEKDDDDDGIRSGLKLSLNYEKVLDAWSDRGSLWADSLLVSSSTSNSCNTTAAAAATDYMGEVPVLMEMELVEGGDRDRDEKRCSRRRRREASVLRYREKRHSRFFSNKIRYQVRKLNADQRPRLKGRFVKRSLEKKIFL